MEGRVPRPALQKQLVICKGWVRQSTAVIWRMVWWFLTQSFSQLFCCIQGVNPKWSGQIPVWPIPFRWHNFWQFRAYQHCSLILSYCERLLLKNSCFTGGWGVWRNFLQAQPEQLRVCFKFEIWEYKVDCKWLSCVKLSSLSSVRQEANMWVLKRESCIYSKNVHFV